MAGSRVVIVLVSGEPLPNALEPPAACPPPTELASLQFGSVLTELAQRWAAQEPGGRPPDRGPAPAGG